MIKHKQRDRLSTEMQRNQMGVKRMNTQRELNEGGNEINVQTNMMRVKVKKQTK